MSEERVTVSREEMAALRAVLASAQELLHYGSYQRDDGLIDTEGRHFQALRTAVQEAQAQSTQTTKGEDNGRTTEDN